MINCFSSAFVSLCLSPHFLSRPPPWDNQWPTTSHRSERCFSGHLGSLTPLYNDGSTSILLLRAGAPPFQGGPSWLTRSKGVSVATLEVRVRQRAGKKACWRPRRYGMPRVKGTGLGHAPCQKHGCLTYSRLQLCLVTCPLFLNAQYQILYQNAKPCYQTPVLPNLWQMSLLPGLPKCRKSPVG